MFNKICGFITKLLPFWVLAACVLGYYRPEALAIFRPHIDWLFAVTMVGIGAVLEPKDFKPIVTDPRSTILGTAAQFAIMPALGFVVAKLLNLPPELALGMIIVGAAPGAMASNVISYLAKTDVPYSIAITTTTTLLAPVLTPAFTYLYGRAYIDIPFLPMFFTIVKMIIIPLAIGLAARHYFKDRLEKIVPLFPAVSTLFIAVICGLVLSLNRQYLISVSLIIFAAVFLHNLLGLILGYGAGRLYGFSKKRTRTLSFEVGMQNAGLGAVISLKHFSAATALPNALFAIWCIITASVLAEIWSRNE